MSAVRRGEAQRVSLRQGLTQAREALEDETGHLGGGHRPDRRVRPRDGDAGEHERSGAPAPAELAARLRSRAVRGLRAAVEGAHGAAAPRQRVRVPVSAVRAGHAQPGWL